MFFERVEQCRGKAEVTFLEVFGILGAIYAGEVEHEVGFTAVAVKFLGSRVDVVLEHFIDLDRIVLSLTLLYVVELGAEVFAYKALRSGY